MKKSELRQFIREEIQKVLNEEFNEFLDTDEGGWMRVYIDNVAEKKGLDLNRNQEFDEAFKLALSKLKKDQPQLDFKAIMANKESFR